MIMKIFIGFFPYITPATAPRTDVKDGDGQFQWQSMVGIITANKRRTYSGFLNCTAVADHNEWDPSSRVQSRSPILSTWRFLDT
jgi:hypothetical protein